MTVAWYDGRMLVDGRRWMAFGRAVGRDPRGRPVDGLNLFFEKSYLYYNQLLDNMNWKDYIISDPKILYGKPAIKGTRIADDLILEKLSAGHSLEDLLKSYPHLNQEQIFACLATNNQFPNNQSPIKAPALHSTPY